MLSDLNEVMLELELEYMRVRPFFLSTRQQSKMVSMWVWAVLGAITGIAIHLGNTRTFPVHATGGIVVTGASSGIGESQTWCGATSHDRMQCRCDLWVCACVDV